MATRTAFDPWDVVGLQGQRAADASALSGYVLRVEPACEGRIELAPLTGDVPGTSR